MELSPNIDYQGPSPNLVQFYYTFLFLEMLKLPTQQMSHDFIVAGDTLCLVLCSLFLVTANIRSAFLIVIEDCTDISMDQK